MRNFFLTMCLLVSVAVTAQVKPGIEVLRDGDFAQLQGKRVGLITNPTGIDNNLKSTIDILHEAPGVELVALYSPEHGVRGDVHAGDKVAEYKDSKTGVPVYSIYGGTLRPTPEMLKDVDVLIYDIQDIGCRSYTFISTMGEGMAAAAEKGIPFMVLDRPNPLGGNRIEGNLVEDGYYSFVSKFAIPYLYGMTPGELALYLNKENGINCDLTVIPMEGWHRDMMFDQTKMPWVLPSPHIPNAETALYYPASGIIGESDYMNIGVGYTLPFKLFCAEWVNADELADALNALNLEGVAFRPIHIKPFYAKGKDQNLQGVETYITDPQKAELTLIQFYVLQEAARLYPDHKFMETSNQKRLPMMRKVTGTDQILERFSKRHRVEDMVDYWRKDNESFRQASKPYYLYD